MKIEPTQIIAIGAVIIGGYFLYKIVIEPIIGVEQFVGKNVVQPTVGQLKNPLGGSLMINLWNWLPFTPKIPTNGGEL